MIYLLDTITFNMYFEYMKNPNKAKIPRHANITNLITLLENSKGCKWIHSASMFELLAKCYKNDSIQKTYKQNNQINLKQFAEDYYFLINEKHFRIMNERPYYFEWEKIVAHYNENMDTNINEFIEAKIKMEVDFLFYYILYVNSICCIKQYDDYESKNKMGYINDESWYECFYKSMMDKIETNLEQILRDYYYKNVSKQEVTNRIDSLLQYVLAKFSDFIDKKLDQNIGLEIDQILVHYEELIKYVSKTSKESIPENGMGAQFARDIFKQDTTRCNRCLEESYQNILNKVSSFTTTAKEYIRYLAKKTILEGSKITKNDASDYLIVSAGDLYKGEKELVLITYDKKMKKFLEEHNKYFNHSVYDKIYYS